MREGLLTSYVNTAVPDGHPVMAAGGPGGHMAFWNLESRRLVTQLRHAHRSSVAGATFLPNQQLLLTNGADNALKVRLLVLFVHSSPSSGKSSGGCDFWSGRCVADQHFLW